MAQLKIVSTDPNNITIDGTPLHEWAIAHQQDTVEKLRVLREEHAAAMETLKAAHRDALAERDAKIEAQATAYTQHHEETHRAVADWQAAQDAEKAKRQAEHEAALKDHTESHAKAVGTLSSTLEATRAAHRKLVDDLKELGDVPQIRAMARQSRRERLKAELVQLDAQEAAEVDQAAIGPLTGGTSTDA